MCVGRWVKKEERVDVVVCKGWLYQGEYVF